MTAPESFTLTCNWCRYNLTVTEPLVPWASEVMLAHAKRSHPSEAPLPKEDPTDETLSG